MSHFTFGQEKLFAKLKMYQEEIAALDFGPSACPLLDNQLNVLAVLLERIDRIVRELRESMEEQP
jgi:hypothetical protein